MPKYKKFDFYILCQHLLCDFSGIRSGWATEDCLLKIPATARGN